MTGTAFKCPQCGMGTDRHDVFGNCPDVPSPVRVGVGVTIRRSIRKWAVPASAVVLAAASLFAGGYVAGHNAARGCVYGGQHLRNGYVAASSVPGVDALCDNGVMIRYVPTAKPHTLPTAA